MDDMPVHTNLGVIWHSQSTYSRLLKYEEETRETWKPIPVEHGELYTDSTLSSGSILVAFPHHHADPADEKLKMHVKMVRI